VSLSSVTLVGFFLGFAFGVGCALAVMYSIYMGGYRAAVRDSRLTVPPERFTRALASASAKPDA
jgi:ABC-type antimicrobial peptide transport system permease subunit